MEVRLECSLLTSAGVVTPPHCLLDAELPGNSLGEIRTRILHPPGELGHMGKGASGQTRGSQRRAGQLGSRVFQGPWAGWEGQKDGLVQVG